MQPVQKVKASKAINNLGNNSKGLEALAKKANRRRRKKKRKLESAP